MRSKAHLEQSLQESHPPGLHLQGVEENLAAKPTCRGGNSQPTLGNRFKGKSHCLWVLTTPPPTTHEIRSSDLKGMAL